jgi:hypothetical protein
MTNYNGRQFRPKGSQSPRPPQGMSVNSSPSSLLPLVTRRLVWLFSAKLATA